MDLLILFIAIVAIVLISGMTPLLVMKLMGCSQNQKLKAYDDGVASQKEIIAMAEKAGYERGLRVGEDKIIERWKKERYADWKISKLDDEI